MGITKINQPPRQARSCNVPERRTFHRQAHYSDHGDRPVMVSPKINATTQMTDNQIQVFTATRMNRRKWVSYSATYRWARHDGSKKVLPNGGQAWHQWRTRDTGYLIQLVHYTGSAISTAISEAMLPLLPSAIYILFYSDFI